MNYLKGAYIVNRVDGESDATVYWRCSMSSKGEVVNCEVMEMWNEALLDGLGT